MSEFRICGFARNNNFYIFRRLNEGKKINKSTTDQPTTQPTANSLQTAS
jgi:hypothetical protein